MSAGAAGPPSAGPNRLEALFEGIADEHRRFLEGLVARSVEELRSEDRRLLESVARELQRENEELNMELESLRRAGIRKVLGDRPSPRVPEAPLGLDNGGAQKANLTVADISGNLPPSDNTWRASKGSSSGGLGKDQGMARCTSFGSEIEEVHRSLVTGGSNDSALRLLALSDINETGAQCFVEEEDGTSRAITLRLPPPLSKQPSEATSALDDGPLRPCALKLKPALAGLRHGPIPLPPPEKPALWDNTPSMPMPMMPGAIEDWQDCRREASVVAQATETRNTTTEYLSHFKRGSCKSFLEPVDGEIDPAQHLKETLRRKQRLRIRYLLGLSGTIRHVTVDMLFDFFSKRYPDTKLRHESVQDVILELKRVYLTHFSGAGRKESRHEGPCLEGFGDSVSQIDLRILVDMLITPDVLRCCSEELRDDVDWFIQAMLKVTVEEVIDSATLLSAAQEDDSITNNGSIRKCPPPYTIMSGMVAFTVLFNILALGISLDFAPTSKVWYFMELVCAGIFLFEVSVKLRMFGLRGYFTGEERIWNMLDCFITMLSLMDVGVSTYSMVSPTTMGGGKSGYAAQMVMLLRALRLTRVIRLIKLLRTPLLQNLANMLTGFMLGLPALFWVVVLFLVVLYVFGLAFRIMWGPGEGQDLISLCGSPDDFAAEKHPSPECAGKLHWMYGEEFFGTVWLSMFTTFRFMLGDYQSRTGVSLAIVFGEGYGAPFHLMFGVGMILAVFGLFNIVTAIFVDSTISGLKHNDAMRKYAQQYEGRYVKTKMIELLERVGEIMITEAKSGKKHSRVSITSDRLGRTSAGSGKGDDVLVEWESIVLTQDDFCEVMEDVRVRSLLHDLDVEMYNPSGFFETFDADDSGTVTVLEMVQAIMRLRGEVRKNDLIASWVAVRALSKRFDQLTLALSVGMERSRTAPSPEGRPSRSRSLTIVPDY